MGFGKGPDSIRVGEEVQVRRCGQSFSDGRKLVSNRIPVDRSLDLKDAPPR